MFYQKAREIKVLKCDRESQRDVKPYGIPFLGLFSACNHTDTVSEGKRKEKTVNMGEIQNVHNVNIMDVFQTSRASLNKALNYIEKGIAKANAKV